MVSYKAAKKHGTRFATYLLKLLMLELGVGKPAIVINGLRMNA
jgi:hypothetical protein